MLDPATIHDSPAARRCDAPPPGPGVGRTLGSYRLDRVISQGGMGIVYEAHHLRLGSRAAVKLPHEESMECPELLELFRKEARVLSQITHPNVVRVLDLDEDDRGPFLVLEYLDGETLADRLARIGRLAVSEALRIVCEIAEALDDVHGHGVVHCDLKPANVYLVKTRRRADLVKLLDFGVSVEVEGGDEVPPPSIGGTPSYMAPEQICAGEIDPRADQYSLAVMTYELLSGRRAFDGPGACTLPALRRHRLGRVSEAAPAVPEAVDEVLRRATSLCPEDRYDDVLAFALEEAVREACPASRAPESGVRAIVPPSGQAQAASGCSLSA